MLIFDPMPAKPLTHEQLADASRLRAAHESAKQKNPSLTQEALAFACGWKTQGAVSQYMRGDIPLNLKALLKFCSALDVAPESVSPSLALLISSQGKSPEGAYRFESRREVPVVGTTQGGPPNRLWEERGFPVGYSDEYLDVSTPDQNAYALRVVGSSMAPRIMEGEWLLVEPNQEALPSDDVVLRTTDGRVMIKQLVSRHNGTFILASVNEAYDRISIDESEVDFIHYVAGRFAARSVKRRVGEKIQTNNYSGSGRRVAPSDYESERRGKMITSEGNVPLRSRETRKAVKK